MSYITHKKIVIDLDDTISITENGKYTESIPNLQVVEKLREYKALGYEIVIHSSRNMRTYNCNLGEINVHTLPVVLDFLNRYDIPYDQVIMGKPWAGYGGFYVDDKSIRPSEFINMTEEEVQTLLKRETEYVRNHKA